MHKQLSFWFGLFLLLVSLAAADAQPALPTGISKQELYGSVIASSKWPKPAIPVCWENPAPEHAIYRKIVERAVQQTWVAQSKSAIVIAQSWEACKPDSPGVRIAVSDERAHTNVLGKYLDSMPSGMVLNFTFSKWSQGCQSKVNFCVFAVAVHEFGHALGFTHEQNRADAPEECRGELASGSVGDYNVTKYDPNSIMNYCNPKWNGDGKLSKLDVSALREFYKN